MVDRLEGKGKISAVADCGKPCVKCRNSRAKGMENPAAFCIRQMSNHHAFRLMVSSGSTIHNLANINRRDVEARLTVAEVIAP
jgi:hypothetical protein